MKCVAEKRETKLMEVNWYKLLCTKEAYRPCKFCEQLNLIPSSMFVRVCGFFFCFVLSCGRRKILVLMGAHIKKSVSSI